MMNDKFQKLDSEKLEQVTGGAGIESMSAGITMQIRPGQNGTVFIGGSKFASIAGLTLEELQAITQEDPRYPLVQEYFAFLERRAQISG